MNLYLLRHGEAEVRAYNDSARNLTARGRQEIEQVANQFLARNVQLACCYSSPYARAVQTAETFLALAAPAIKPEITPVLIPEIRANEVMRFLTGVREQDVLLVSHNPLVSELLALLTDGDISNMHILGTSELVCISLDVIGLGMGVSPFTLVPDASAFHS